MSSPVVPEIWFKAKDSPQPPTTTAGALAQPVSVPPPPSHWIGKMFTKPTKSPNGYSNISKATMPAWQKAPVDLMNGPGPSCSPDPPGAWSGFQGYPGPTGPPPMSYPISAAAPMWDLGYATTVIQYLQPLVQSYGYHLCLGGGVLNTGQSTKDLDLYLLPLNNPKIKAQPMALLTQIAEHFGDIAPIGAEYPDKLGTDLPYALKAKFEHYKTGKTERRVDLFILGAQADANLYQKILAGLMFAQAQEKAAKAAALQAEALAAATTVQVELGQDRIVLLPIHKKLEVL
jgi:hypothetical protein